MIGEIVVDTGGAAYIYYLRADYHLSFFDAIDFCEVIVIAV